MNDRVPLQLPTHTFFALAAYLQESGSDANAEEVAATAIAEWIAQERARAAVGRSVRARGYQWKGLFLPEGTRLRMLHDGKFHYAEVQGDDIVFNGRSVSPARMANEVAGCTRNAWRDLWLLLPGESAWRLASVRRRQAGLIGQAIAAGAATAGLPAAACAPHAAPALASAPLAAPAAASGPADALLRRLAGLLERSIEARQPLYRRRTDLLAED